MDQLRADISHPRYGSEAVAFKGPKNAPQRNDVARESEEVHRTSQMILIVEDEWLLRQALLDEVSAAGWMTLEAYSGESALKLLDEGARPDLLITDIRLGGSVTGWDVADACRKINAGVPIVYLSANQHSKERAAAGSVFLDKPCDTEKLLEVCRALFESPRPPQ